LIKGGEKLKFQLRPIVNKKRGALILQSILIEWIRETVEVKKAEPGKRENKRDRTFFPKGKARISRASIVTSARIGSWLLI